jgi:hypothetical protein
VSFNSNPRLTGEYSDTLLESDTVAGSGPAN